MIVPFRIEKVRASSTIYIRADGSIEPASAPIATEDLVIYTYTDNLTGSLVIERDNIIVTGNGYTLQAPGPDTGYGIFLERRTNVTVVDMKIKGFNFGVLFDIWSSKCTISANTVSDCIYGIYISRSSRNTISYNDVSGNTQRGIVVWSDSDNNMISDNIITGNTMEGIMLSYSAPSGTAPVNNTIIDNVLANNGYGVRIGYAQYTTLYHNDFINNAQQAEVVYGWVNFWDNGYPSGGNYWSDYGGTDSDGDAIGDTPYIIDVGNQDNYPLMEPWSPANIPQIGEPRGIFVRLGQLLGIDPNTQTVSNETAVAEIGIFVDAVSTSNLNVVYLGFRDDDVCYDYSRPSEGGYVSGILMYHSTLYPEMVYGPVQHLLDAYGFDPIEYLITELHAVDIEVHAWVPIFLDRLGIITRSLAAQPLREPGIHTSTDPRDPDVQAYNLAVITEITYAYQIDGVNLDYVRCDEMATDTCKEESLDEIVDFISEIRGYIGTLVLSADVFSWDIEDARGDPSSWGRESGRWIAQDYVRFSECLDVVMPMTYFAADGEEPSWVGDRASYFRSQVFSPYVVPIVQAYTENGTYDITAQDVVDAVVSARGSEADGFSWFTYIHIRDELGGLDGICQSVCQQPALCSWKIAASIATGEESYWFCQPNIVFSGGFEWIDSEAPLASSALTIQLRNPDGIWMDDWEISTQTNSEGLFVSQLTEEWMMLGPWMTRAKDSTYGSAGVTTFEVTPLPGDLLFMALSPVDIHVYDQQDRHVGVNRTGGIELEVPGAYYSGPDSEPEWVLVPNAPLEDFRSRLAGTENGNFTFKIIYTKNETATLEETFTGLIEAGANRTFSVHFSEGEPGFCDWHACGDVDADWDVDIFDLVKMAGVYGVRLPDPRYDPNCDLDDDGDIDIFDIVAACSHYGESW